MDFYNLPDYIKKHLEDEQEYAGCERDLSVFNRDRKATRFYGGFGWWDAEIGKLHWWTVMQKYSKEEFVKSYDELIKPLKYPEPDFLKYNLDDAVVSPIDKRHADMSIKEPKMMDIG